MNKHRLLNLFLAAAIFCASAVFAGEVKGNKKSKKYHTPACKHYAAKGSTEAFESEQAAQKAGYTACKKCSESKTEKKAQSKK
jgi:methylphosphotriester-DNA--protein-cysteine methyltransferase